ncbi:hypothetical protein BDZ85DRAFT_83933 [Elsinoe ampelina]|uniref:Uncharacterized protein n=1 Tax=Elsinoe ampelina TaxID=302913 RepID=A0A6A6GGB0_9PEZI|nr:hypothetical protein BDZ85DRAFT_83933 [Elsinoe ampelina]
MLQVRHLVTFLVMGVNGRAGRNEVVLHLQQPPHHLRQVDVRVLAILEGQQCARGGDARTAAWFRRPSNSRLVLGQGGSGVANFDQRLANDIIDDGINVPGASQSLVRAKIDQGIRARAAGDVMICGNGVYKVVDTPEADPQEAVSTTKAAQTIDEAPSHQASRVFE